MAAGMSLLVKVIGTLLLLYVSSCLYCLIRNILIARKTGFPCMVTPVNQEALPWVVLSVGKRQWLKDSLPAWLWDRIYMTIYGWEYHERNKAFEAADPTGKEKSFILASLGSAECWTVDPVFATEILRRPMDFKQQPITSQILSVFGDNVLTTDGQIWSRHRKVVASVINERISKSVWDESVKQTQGMLRELFDNDDTKDVTSSNQLPEMLKRITVLVLSGAGMGTSKNWEADHDDKPAVGYRQTYIECTKTILTAMTGTILLPVWFMQAYPSFLPGYSTLKALRYAIEEFPRHTQSMLSAERQRLEEEPGDVKHNILSQLVTASSKEKKDAALSDPEMRGNLFVSVPYTNRHSCSAEYRNISLSIMSAARSLGLRQTLAALYLRFLPGIHSSWFRNHRQHAQLCLRNASTTPTMADVATRGDRHHSARSRKR